MKRQTFSAQLRHGTPSTASGRLPLRCSYCGETWEGPASGIGKTCAANPLLGSPDVRQCEPEELECSIDWAREVF